MKRKYTYFDGQKQAEREYSYIPVRYILAVLMALLEVLAVIGIVVALCYYVPYFYLAALATQIACVIRIVSSDDNPDYKVPWLLFVLIIPIAGFMLYFMFYSRTLSKRFVRRLEALKSHGYRKDDTALFSALEAENPLVASQAKMLCSISDAHLFSHTKQEYFLLGEAMHRRLLEDLEQAQSFIYMEYFIIEEGVFWNSILDVLKRKAAAGVEVKVLYDDIGCMMTVPGNYDKILQGYGIEAAIFSRLKGSADSEFNNRSHRKITVIDGRIGYTGGINLADEYINRVERYGHWKDVGLRLEGEGVKELTKLFLIDYGINVKQLPPQRHDYFAAHSVPGEGYVMPFGDGPMPIYPHQVGKTVIQNLLNHATRYVWIMTPYLVVDNELSQTLVNTALRGVEVKLILPHIPDKKIVFEMARSSYRRLMDAGVRIYEYEPGFVHAKCYLADDELAMVGTINLDYRSLVHHFENGVWMYRCDCLTQIHRDFEETLTQCLEIGKEETHRPLHQRFFRAILKLFAPMM